LSFLPAHLVFPRGGARGCASQETYRLIASRNMVCSLSVHDSRDLVIVYALRVFAASIIAAEVFIAARTCVWSLAYAEVFPSRMFSVPNLGPRGDACGVTGP
jgi:hypothetical protein